MTLKPLRKALADWDDRSSIDNLMGASIDWRHELELKVEGVRLSSVRNILQRCGSATPAEGLHPSLHSEQHNYGNCVRSHAFPSFIYSGAQLNTCLPPAGIGRVPHQDSHCFWQQCTSALRDIGVK